MCSLGPIPHLCVFGDCYEEKRDEIILGTDFSPDLDVQPADSILERLFVLLANLYVDDIADGVNDHGWDAYFSPVLSVPDPIRASNVAWDNIIITGFSQGAGHAARISNAYAVHGTVMIDGPGDSCLTLSLERVSAPWMSQPDASAGRPRYGAMHAQWTDLFGLAEGEVPVTWAAMGIPADGLVNIDPDPGAQSRVGPNPNPIGPIDLNLDRLLPPAQAMSTNQTPAGGDDECLAIITPGFPSDTSQKHGSMADDRCMPTSQSGGELAMHPSETYLFRHYLKRFCYACDAAVCP